MNTQMFSSQKSQTLTTNKAGGAAYKTTPASALARYAVTGCFNNLFYANAETQMEEVKKLIAHVNDEFIAKLAVYARKNGLMKDFPAFLLAVLCARNTSLLEKVFPKVIDSPKMLRNFVQIIRSGQVGRKSFGSKPKKLIQKYLESLSDEQLFKADIGNSPSLQDVIKMVHPKPSSKSRENLYAYLLDKKYDKELLPNIVKEFEKFKKTGEGDVKDVPFQMLTSQNLSNDNWKTIAENATWNQLRMNLNSFYKHGVFSSDSLVQKAFDKLSNAVEVKKSKTFPYQLFAAYLNVDPNLPSKLVEAINLALETSTENVPKLEGNVYICLDISGSMGDSATGNRGTATSKMRFIDIASLFTSTLIRNNPNTKLIVFNGSAKEVSLSPNETVLNNAKKLSSMLSGGTDCAKPLELMNVKNHKADLIIYFSDNQSWMSNSFYGKTSMQNEWNKFKTNNPSAKLICMDIAPYGDSQVIKDESVLNIGGFSDTIFNLIQLFHYGAIDSFEEVINNVEI